MKLAAGSFSRLSCNKIAKGSQGVATFLLFCSLHAKDVRLRESKESTQVGGLHHCRLLGGVVRPPMVSCYKIIGKKKQNGRLRWRPSAIGSLLYNLK